MKKVTNQTKTYLVTNESEAIAMSLKIMAKQDALRYQRYGVCKKIVESSRDAQYAHHSCTLQLLENELTLLTRALVECCAFITMPLNCPI